MADSWEEEAESFQQPPPRRPAPSLNPNAASFSFNPTASTFTPKPVSATPSPPPPPPPAAPTPTPPQPEPEPVVQTDEEMHDAEHADEAMEKEATALQNGINKAAEQLQDMSVDEKPAAVTPPTPPPAASPSKPQQTAEEEEEEEDEKQREAQLKKLYEELSKEDDREHMNIVMIGHVDAGKSTIGGQVLYLTGGVDERTIQKYEREAKDKNRESWYMAYIMDTNEEERAKGKTVEVGRAQFETKKKRYTILDAPGHKNYVPNMIGGAAQADVGVLVISARKGEFETGFERGGQTREHAQLAKTLGVSRLIVVVNKMDDPSSSGPNGEWSKERYDEIQSKITPFLRSCGYNPKKDLVFLPISGLFGANIKDRVEAKTCPWYQGPSLFEVLDDVEPQERDPLAPFRMSVIDKYKDMGTIAMGKSESGIVRKGDKLFVMPNKVPVQVVTIYRDDAEVAAAKGGENLRLRLSGIDDEELQAGFVICSRHQPVPIVTYFNAQLQILELLEHKAIFSAGYKAVLHLHSLVEECEATALLAQIDPKTKEKKKVASGFVKNGAIAMVRITVEKPICAERFDTVPQLGRFTLRDEGRTIAIGKIVRLPKSLKEGV